MNARDPAHNFLRNGASSEKNMRVNEKEMARLFRSNPRQKAPQLCAIFSDCLAVRLQVFVYVAL
ncbi:hypothetical protein [Porphyromonas loveana]|uniref:hypothetical protein n=1 Tax=Porphyromonas loveana TaxID=1884669 RepID=UPI001057C46E